MKQKFKFFITVGFLLILSGTLFAQDFTVIYLRLMPKVG